MSWNPLSSVSQGHAGPNTGVTAVSIAEGRIALFAADPGGGVFSNIGHPDKGWGLWTTVSQGHSGPNRAISAVPIDKGRIALFLADPGGGVFTAFGHPLEGWSGWSHVSEGRAGANTSVTAMPINGGRVALFAADPDGGVFANVGHPERGWRGWRTVSEGRAGPNIGVIAIKMGTNILLFVADPGGGVFANIGHPDRSWIGWSSVGGARAGQNTFISAVPIGGGRAAVFFTDPKGEVFTTAGDTSHAIKHLFVLMLENRSFDHMLGFSEITGIDATTGQPTKIDGLTGNESNDIGGRNFTVTRGAPDVWDGADGPAHDFEPVLEQLCGEGAKYPSGGHYPSINNSGFVSSYAKRENPQSAPKVMRCFTPDQLPVLTALAREFVVCDRWFSSMPGPTEPNRFFMHAGTSGTFDDSPSELEIIAAVTTAGGGFKFRNGNIFQLLKKAGVEYRIYADDRFPACAELDDVSVVFDIREFEDLAEDLQSPSFDASFVHIEPAYNAIVDFQGGNSQHPNGGRVSDGERFIKATYEAIRNSPVWESSMLIIVYDEHGGFYDHVAPGTAPGTGERGRKHGFTFEQLGPRVPAIVVSPLIPRNLIDHTEIDHAAIPATLRQLFRIPALTPRDRASRGVGHLVTLHVPRTDAPLKLPDAAVIGGAAVLSTDPFLLAAPPRPDGLLADEETGLLTAALHSAVVQHLQVTPQEQHAAIRARVALLRTRADLFEYMKEVERLVRAKRVQAGVVGATSGVANT